MTRRFDECFRNTSLVFNSILLTTYDWLNDEITEFNRIMFELSFQHSNMIFFGSHEILMNSLMPGERRQECGAAAVTFAAKPLVTSELITGLTCLALSRSGQVKTRKLQQWSWPIRTVFDNVYRNFIERSKIR